MELFVECGVELILVLAFGRGRRTFACGAILRVAAICISVVVLIIVLVVSVRSPAVIGAAISSRASVVV